MTDRDTGEVRRYALESAGFGLGDQMVKRDDGDWHLHEDCAADHDEVVATLRARVSELEEERDGQAELRGYIAEISRAIDDDTLRGRVDSIFAILEGQLKFTTDGEPGVRCGS